MPKIFLLVLGGLLLSGCASNIPKEIASVPENSLTASQVLKEGREGIGQIVRWGGVIAAVSNKKDQTWLEIVAKDLNRNGRPVKSDKSAGRFLVKVNQFLEPEIYSKGRLVTIVGKLAEKEAGKIGEQPYDFPVVHSSKTWLWEEVKVPQYQYPGHPGSYWPYYDPFWDLRLRNRFFFGHGHHW